MSMGARVLICSRCWPRLSRWLGFKRSFWRPSTSWDTWTFLYFKNEHLKKADILRHKFWHEMTLADKKIWYCPLNPGPTARVPSNEWDWRINTKQVKCGSKQDHKLVLSRPSIAGDNCHFPQQNIDKLLRSQLFTMWGQNRNRIRFVQELGKKQLSVIGCELREVLFYHLNEWRGRWQ